METPVAIHGRDSNGKWRPIGINDPVAATQTLTLVANPSNNDTATVGGKTYTFQTTLTNVANNVKIGLTASITLDNFIAAINRDSGDGTLYAAATKQNTMVSAAAGAGDTMVVTARNPGAVGNDIAATENFANAGNVWGAATLSGGLDAALISSPQTVGGTRVAGITETRSLTKDGATTASYTIPAGALSILVKFHASFAGTVNGMAVVEADGSYSDAAMPGNTLPAIIVTRSAGTYSVIEGRPA